MVGKKTLLAGQCFFLAGGASFTSNYSAEARKEDTLRHSVDHYTSAQGLHLEFTICKLEL